MASVMILGMLNGWDPQLSLDRAQALASAIVTRRGATVSEPAFYQQFLNDWSPDAMRTKHNQEVK